MELCKCGIKNTAAVWGETHHQVVGHNAQGVKTRRGRRAGEDAPGKK